MSHLKHTNAINRFAAIRNLGFTQIELGIALVIVGILLTQGMASAVIWMNNVKIRTAADNVSAGLQVARVEALRRNRSVQFVLTDSDPSQTAVSSIVPSPN